MTETEIRPQPSTKAQLGRYMTVIFNNDTTTVDAVMTILMLATGCDQEEAYMETWEAHTYGKAPVHFSSEDECVRVARIIETVGVVTEVCKEWND